MTIIISIHEVKLNEFTIKTIIPHKLAWTFLNTCVCHVVVRQLWKQIQGIRIAETMILNNGKVVWSLLVSSLDPCADSVVAFLQTTDMYTAWCRISSHLVSLCHLIRHNCKHVFTIWLTLSLLGFPIICDDLFELLQLICKWNILLPRDGICSFRDL